MAATAVNGRSNVSWSLSETGGKGRAKDILGSNMVGYILSNTGWAWTGLKGGH
jgi:hypothetical protein